MIQSEFTSRVSTQLKMISKDDYYNDRLILSTGQSISKKFISQKLRNKGLGRGDYLFTEVPCIEFEKVDVYSCPYIEFRSCRAISKSKCRLESVLHTKQGFAIKALYSIDRFSKTYTQDTLHNHRINSQRYGYEPFDKFFILDNYIYVLGDVKILSGLMLSLDIYDLESSFKCSDNCESAWDKEFVCPDDVLEDVIQYTVQNMLQTKQIPEDENPNLNSNER